MIRYSGRLSGHRLTGKSMWFFLTFLKSMFQWVIITQNIPIYIDYIRIIVKNQTMLTN